MEQGERHLEQEGELKKKRVFIELGTDDAPVPFIGERKFDDNEIYIGIDRHP